MKRRDILLANREISNEDSNIRKLKMHNVPLCNPVFPELEDYSQQRWFEEDSFISAGPRNTGFLLMYGKY